MQDGLRGHRSVVTEFAVVEDDRPRRAAAGGRPRKGPRVLKPEPYPRGKKRWRVRVFEPRGARTKEQPAYFRTESEAWTFYRTRLLELGGRSLVARALDDYAEHKRLARRKRNAPDHDRKVETTIKKARQRIERFFRGLLDTNLLELRIEHVQALYDKSLEEDISTVHRNNALSETKAFLRWAGGQGIVARTVVDRLGDVVPQGDKERGSRIKLRVDELRQLMRTCLAAYDESRDMGALAVLMCVRVNTRSEDLLALQVRDVNDDGRALYFESAKTENAEGYRALRCDATRQRLLDAVADKAPTDYVFASNRTNGHMRWRFLNRAITRLCADAKVPRVNAKQLRASAAECKVLSGSDPIEATARDMGHSHAARGKVARRHYLSADVVADVDAARINNAIGGLN